MILTGTFMACTWGSKVNGILTVFAVGLAVLIDLWDILDVKKNKDIVRRLSTTLLERQLTQG